MTNTEKLKKWLDANPTKGIRDGCRALGISLSGKYYNEIDRRVLVSNMKSEMKPNRENPLEEVNEYVKHNKGGIRAACKALKVSHYTYYNMKNKLNENGILKPHTIHIRSEKPIEKSALQKPKNDKIIALIGDSDSSSEMLSKYL